MRELNDTTEDNYIGLVSQYFDLNLLLTHLALENFLADFDGILGDWGLNNFFLYQFENQKRWQFIVWGKDNTFAAPEDFSEPRRAIEFPILRYFDGNQLVRRGINVPEVRETYFS